MQSIWDWPWRSKMVQSCGVARLLCVEKNVGLHYIYIYIFSQETILSISMICMRWMHLAFKCWCAQEISWDSPQWLEHQEWLTSTTELLSHGFSAEVQGNCWNQLWLAWISGSIRKKSMALIKFRGKTWRQFSELCAMTLPCMAQGNIDLAGEKTPFSPPNVYLIIRHHFWYMMNHDDINDICMVSAWYQAESSLFRYHYSMD